MVKSSQYVIGLTWKSDKISKYATKKAKTTHLEDNLVREGIGVIKWVRKICGCENVRWYEICRR